MQSSLRHRLLLKANFQKLCDIFKMYDSGTRPSRSTGSRHAQKHQTCDLTTHCDLEKGCSGSTEPASAPSAVQSRVRALIILQGGAARFPTPGFLYTRALTWSWPGSSPGCYDQAAGWLSSSLCPPCYHTKSPPLAPPCSRPADTWEVRRRCDTVLPSQTVGKMETQKKL